MRKLFIVFLIFFGLQITSQAQADTGIVCATSMVVSGSLVDLERVSMAANRSDILAMAWSCTRSFFMGAWDATGGSALDAWDCITSPIDCANSAVDGVRNAWNFMQNFSSRISEMYQSIINLTPQQKVDLICEMVGAIGASVAVAILTAGPGSALAARVIAGLAVKLQKIARVLRSVSRISHRKLARLSDVTLDKLDEMTQLGYGRFMRDAVEACPL